MTDPTPTDPTEQAARVLAERIHGPWDTLSDDLRDPLLGDARALAAAGLLAAPAPIGDLYVHLVADRPASARQREVSPGVTLDYDVDGRPIGVEVVRAVSVEIGGQPVAAPAAQPDETGWMVGQRVEWNPTEGQWVPATIALVSADEEMALIMRADNLQYLNVLTRHLRPASAVSAAPARSVAHSEAADRDDEAVERAQPDDDLGEAGR